MSNGLRNIIIDKEIRAMELDIATAQGSLKIFKSLKDYGIETIEVPVKNDSFEKNGSEKDVGPEEIVKKIEQIAKEMGAQVVTTRQDVDESIDGK